MRVAITGTPGTGKTSVGDALRSRGYNVLNMTQYIRENGLREEYDDARDTYGVDVEKLNDSLKDMKDTIFEGHLSHFLDVDRIVVMRCSPEVMQFRLKTRGYSDAKVRENVEAELLDIILCESVDSGIPTYAVDTSDCNVTSSADAVEDIIKGKVIGHMPEDITWAEELEKWF